MAEHHEVIRSFRSRLWALLALRYALSFLILYAFAWGTGVLALRAAWGVARAPLLWGLAGAPLALVPAALLAWRRVPSVSAVRALLDRHGSCGGLLMAEEEVVLGPWGRQVPELTAPRLRWRGGRSWGLLGAASGFVLACFLVPQGLADLGGGPRLDVDREVERLGKQIDVLKEEKVLEEARAADLKEKLDRVREEARGKDPVKTLEALDHVQDVVKKAARDAAESAAKKNEELGRAEEMVELLRKKKKDGGLDAKLLAKGMDELRSLTRKAAGGGDLLKRRLDREALDRLRDGKGPSPEELKKLLDALREGKGELEGKLVKLYKARLIDLETLQKCERAGKCDGEALAAFLKENGADPALCDALAQCDKPGSGAPTRGPGAAPLTWKDKSTEEGVKFKEQALPPGALAKLKDSQRIGVGRGKPKAEPGGPAGSGALAGAASGGGSASTQVVLPRHRAAVGRYFERPRNQEAVGSGP
jgi:hypothetical protein